MKIRKMKKLDAKGVGKGHTPLRTCIVCGRKSEKARLIRLVMTEDGKVIMDIKGNMHGRGGYVHGSEACRKELPNSRNLRRAFKGRDPRSFSPDLIVI